MKKIKHLKKYRLIAVETLFLCFMTACVPKSQTVQNAENSADFTYNEDGSVTLGEGYVAYGFCDGTGDIVNSGEELECVEGKITGNIRYQQNKTSKVEYGLIVMTDYVQQSFKVDGKPTRFYTFELTGEDEICIPIELEVTEQSYEMEYLIISEPKATAEDFISGDDLKFNNIYASQERSTGCFPIKGREEPEKIIKNLEFVDWPITLGFDLIEGEYIPFCRAKSGQKSTMVIGQEGVDLDYYIVVAFCDWEQVSLNKGELVGYFDFNEGKNGSYEITFPQAKDGAMYQMFLFGKPNAGSFGAATFRVELSK